MTNRGSAILLVCTANQCRSPLAAAIATREAGKRPLHFDSAGLLDGGRSTPKAGVTVAEELGLDLSAHLSRKFDVSEARKYSVILTMTREQAREIVALDPQLWPRVLPLKQFSRWLREHPYPSNVDLGTWMSSAAAGRPLTEIMGSSAEDDVRDPLRSSLRVWRSVANDLQEQLRSVIGSLYPAETG